MQNKEVTSKIEMRHTVTIIHNYDIGDNEFIERKFSIYNKTCHRLEPKGMYYDQENKDLYLPAGLEQYFIDRAFGDDIYRKVYPDTYDKIPKVRLKYLPRDEKQKEAIRFCLGMDPYRRNLNKPQLQLNLNTGVGKTYVAVTTFAYLSIKTMMITSSLDWIDQWREKIKEYTDLKDDEIYTIAGMGTIAKLINGMKDISKIKFFLCSHSTLKSFAKKHGWNMVGALFRRLKIGVKIYDEAHLWFDNICMIDFFTDTYKTFYLTATPIQSDYFDNRIYQAAFKTVPSIDLFDEDKDPHTKYISILFNSHPRPQDIQECANVYGFDRIKYTDYLTTKENYYKILKILLVMIEQTVSTQGKVLIYIGTNAAILKTFYWIRYNYPNLPVGLFSSLVPKDVKQRELENKIILTTTKSAGAALDIKGLEMTIVLNEPFKSKVLTKQTFGRTRSDNTRYIDVVDVGFSTLKYYYTTKKPLFKKIATDCSEIQLSDYEINQKLHEIFINEQKQLESFQTNKNLKQVIEITKTIGKSH